MAEIKSTLDLIMERTKGLTMTDEEKRVFRERETAGRIRGIVQKCLDGLIDLNRFQAEMIVLKREVKDDTAVDRLLGEECLDRIELGGNNEALLRILENIAGRIPAEALRKVVAGFETKAVELGKSLRKTLLQNFREKGISGSAVLPNLDADPEWARVRTEMNRQLRDEIAERLKTVALSR